MVKKTASSEAKKLEKLWARCIKTRAEYKCEFCGKSDGVLNSHHIEGKQSNFMRLNLANGVCLCFTCHSDIHSKNGRTAQLKVEKRLSEIRDQKFLDNLRIQKFQAPTLSLPEVLDVKEFLNQKLNEMS